VPKVSSTPVAIEVEEAKIGTYYKKCNNKHNPKSVGYVKNKKG